MWLGLVSPPTHLAGAATAVACGEEREETEAGHQHCQQGQAQPALAQVAVSVITGTNVLIWNKRGSGGNVRQGAVTCKVFILVMTVVEKTLGTRQTRHALDSLLQHVWSVPTWTSGILRLETNYFLFNIFSNISHLWEKLMAMHTSLLQ